MPELEIPKIGGSGSGSGTDNPEPPQESETPPEPQKTKKFDDAETYYAWSRFPAQRDEETGFVTKWIMEGEKVTPKKLGITADQFNEVVAAGSVRTQPYPVPHNAPESPNEWRKKKLFQLAEAAGEE